MPELAKRSGVSRPAISDMVNQKTNAKAGSLEKLSDALGKPLPKLGAGEDSTNLVREVRVMMVIDLLAGAAKRADRLLGSDLIQPAETELWNAVKAATRELQGEAVTAEEDGKAPEFNDFSRRLRFAAEGAGLSEGDLATIFGVSALTVSEWFQGKYMPQLEFLMLLPDILNVSGYWLLTARGQMTAGAGASGPTRDHRKQEKGERVAGSSSG